MHNWALLTQEDTTTAEETNTEPNMGDFDNAVPFAVDAWASLHRLDYTEEEILQKDNQCTQAEDHATTCSIVKYRHTQRLPERKAKCSEIVYPIHM